MDDGHKIPDNEEEEFFNRSIIYFSPVTVLMDFIISVAWSILVDPP